MLGFGLGICWWVMRVRVLKKIEECMCLKPIRSHQVVQWLCAPTTTSRPLVILQVSPSVFLSFSISLPPEPEALLLRLKESSPVLKSHSTQQCHTLPVVVESGKDVRTWTPCPPSWHCSGSPSEVVMPLCFRGPISRDSIAALMQRNIRPPSTTCFFFCFLVILFFGLGGTFFFFF